MLRVVRDGKAIDLEPDDYLLIGDIVEMRRGVSVTYENHLDFSPPQAQA